MLPVLSLDRPKTRAIRRRTPPSRVPRQIVQSKVFPRKRARYVLGAVRREVQIPECARRKVFKATMMRKLAAQAAGRGGVKRWRRTLKRGSAVRVQNNC